MGRFAAAAKALIQIGGTGVPYITPRNRDIVYSSPWEQDDPSTPRVTPAKAMSYIPFFAAVRAIAEDLASLPLGIYRKQGDLRTERNAHPVHRLLHDSPNPYMSSFTFRETLQAHVLTWGNGYAEIEYADGVPVGLWPLRPDRVEVLLDGQTLIYRIHLDRKDVDLPRQRIFHLHGLGFDGLTGYSVISKAAATLAVAVAGTTHASRSMEKGQVPPAVLKHPATLSEEARQRLRNDWDSIDHRDRMTLLEEGLDIKEIGIPSKDAQFIETMDMTRSLMATLFRIPPHMLGDVTRSTSWGTGIEQQGIAYVVHTLRPWLVRWEQEIKVRLLGVEASDYAHFTVDGLMRGDSAARWAAYSAGLNAGVYSVNDVLAMEDRNPIPTDKGGDIRRAPLNMAALESFLKEPTEELMPVLPGANGHAVPVEL